MRFFRSIFGERWFAANRVLTTSVIYRQLSKPAVEAQYKRSLGSVLYVAASSLPYHTSGYTTRTHEVIGALQANGANVHVLTRPGYPWDRKDRLCDSDSLETVLSDIRYLHFRQPSVMRPVLQFAFQAADPIANIAKSHKVAAIHAASNHVNALPALFAARKLGIPFHYEMRGLWELTRVSRFPEYENSQAFKQGLALEGLVATSADRLYVISEQLSRYVQERWGVDPQKISLLPNCIDPHKFKVPEPSLIQSKTIGYAGSLIGYEGLDLLLEAVAILRAKNVLLEVQIVGDGEARSDLEKLSARLGLSQQVKFLGRMTPIEARNVIARCALVCLPRKPFKVCKIVTPIKLVEALALAKPVVVPDLPVFRDELTMYSGHSAGMFFKAGDSEDLARVLAEAFSDEESLLKLGVRARQHALESRTWAPYVQDIVDRLKGEVS